MKMSARVWAALGRGRGHGLQCMLNEIRITRSGNIKLAMQDLRWEFQLALQRAKLVSLRAEAERTRVKTTSAFSLALVASGLFAFEAWGLGPTAIIGCATLALISFVVFLLLRSDERAVRRHIERIEGFFRHY